MSASPQRPAVRIHPSAFVLPPSAFFLAAIGCLGIATQLILLRELMAAYGGNEFSAGVTVAVWILCEALGAWLAGRKSYIVYRTSFLTAPSILSSLIAVPLAVLIRPLLGVLPGETLSIPLLLLATFAVVLLPAATHGALFVAAAAHRTQGIGSAYVWEGVGTALAGVSCFFLLYRLPSLAVVALSALPLCVAAGIGYGRARTKWMMWILGFGALALLVFGLPAEKLAWAAAWKGQGVTAVANSPYGKVIQLERAGQQLILYDGLPVLTVPPTQTERIEELSLLPSLYHPAPRRVLVLGTDLTIPAALARFRPDIEVISVQLDPVLARMSLSALSSDSSFVTHHSSLITSDSSLLPPLVSLTIADPVSFLRSVHDTPLSPESGVLTSTFDARRLFDCIILTDAVPSSLGDSRLFSAEFYRLCHSRLAPGGLLATAGPGNPIGLSPDIVRILSTRLRTLRTAFRHVLPVAADIPLLLASDRPLDVSTETLLIRLARLSEPPKLLDSSYVSSLFDPFRQEALASALETGDPHRDTGISSARSPRELFLNMVRENRLASPAFGAVYARLGSLSIVGHSSFIVLLLSAILLVVGVAGARARGHTFGRGFSILTSGFSGAAVSSLLIFAWQMRFGSVFSGLTLLISAFMLGTVLGGILGSRSSLVLRPSSIVHRFFVSDLALAACAAAAVALIRGGPAGMFLVANCLAGACLGFQFAVAGSIVHRSSSIVSGPATAARRAGILTALDLAGGSLGGILTALVLVPVFGIGTAALLAGSVKLVSSLAQLVPSRAVSQP
jgi:spermidine synthase